jgi:hypothetical protein
MSAFVGSHSAQPPSGKQTPDAQAQVLPSLASALASGGSPAAPPDEPPVAAPPVAAPPDDVPPDDALAPVPEPPEET